MIEWIKSLTIFESIYFYLALVATVFLVIQIIMMCFSIGDDVDLDGDGMLDSDGDAGVSVFTTKSLTAFFAVGGWAGLLVAKSMPQNVWISVLVAVVAGIAAMAVVVLVMRGIMRLQCSGTVETDKLIGQRATVYVPIPSARSGRGKITLVAQGKFSEFDAITDDAEKLKTDENVEIVAIENQCMVVKKI